MRPLSLALVMAMVTTVPTMAQEAGTIAPGMTAEEVRDVFGAPSLVRQHSPWTYLFYANGCTPGCGSDDVVFLRQGQVVAAVLRSPARRFSGPAAATALRAAAPVPSSGSGSIQIDTSDGGVVRGIRIQTPAAKTRREAPVDLGVIRGPAPQPTPEPSEGEVRTVPADTIPSDTVPNEPTTAPSAETP